jgi:6-phosphogluconolactonase
MKLRRFDTAAECLAALGDEIAGRMRKAIAARGQASLALSGGNSPLPLYARLAGEELGWSKVALALVDERWLPVSSDASNEKQLRRVLAPALEKGASLTGMKSSDRSAAAGLVVCEARYAALPLPFDSLLLGMGSDGHTASLFPAADGLEAALDPAGESRCAAIMARESAVTGTYTERLTLTLAAILQARHIDLLLFGDAKLAVLDRAMAGDDIVKMPVRAVLQQAKTPVTVWWAKEAT